MATYEDWIAGQEAMAMVTAIYAATKPCPKDEGRLPRKQCRQFLATARGSLHEINP